MLNLSNSTRYTRTKIVPVSRRALILLQTARSAQRVGSRRSSIIDEG